MPKQKEKAVVFQGTGYQIIRGDPRNLELHVLGGKLGRQTSLSI